MEIRKTFSKKISFDGTKELVGFYNKNKTPSDISKIEKNNYNKSNKKIIIIFAIINIILIPIVFFVAKRRYIKRKINANELDSFLVNNKKENEKEDINIEIGIIE